MTSDRLARGTAARAAAPRDRFEGVDLARFVALIGMMCAHLLPAGSAPVVERLWEGNPSTLFAVVGGISIVLATRKQLSRGEVAAARRSLLARAVVVLAIGVVLALLSPYIIVVLVYYGTSMIATIPFLRVRSRWLLIAAGALALIGPLANAGVRDVLGTDNEGLSIGPAAFAEPAVVLRTVVVTGMYPVITWLGYMLVGMVAGRLLLRARTRGAEGRLAAWFAGIGTAALAVSAGLTAIVDLAVARPRLLSWGNSAELVDRYIYSSSRGAARGVEWWDFAMATPHTGTTPDMVRGVGAALLVLAAALAIMTHAAPVLRRLLRPAVAAGAAPLTLYTLHVVAAGSAGVLFLAVAENPAAGVPWWVQSPAILACHLLGALLLGALLARLGRRGPLESLAGAAAGWAAQLGRPRTAATSPPR